MQKLIAETDKFDLVLVYKLGRLSHSQRDTLCLIEGVFLPIHFGDVLVENAHEPIVTLEQFQAVQAIRAKRREQYGTA